MHRCLGTGCVTASEQPVDTHLRAGTQPALSPPARGVHPDLRFSAQSNLNPAATFPFSGCDQKFILTTSKWGGRWHLLPDRHASQMSLLVILPHSADEEAEAQGVDVTWQGPPSWEAEERASAPGPNAKVHIISGGCPSNCKMRRHAGRDQIQHCLCLRLELSHLPPWESPHGQQLCGWHPPLGSFQGCKSLLHGGKCFARKQSWPWSQHPRKPVNN